MNFLSAFTEKQRFEPQLIAHEPCQSNNPAVSAIALVRFFRYSGSYCYPVESPQPRFPLVWGETIHSSIIDFFSHPDFYPIGIPTPRPFLFPGRRVSQLSYQAFAYSYVLQIQPFFRQQEMKWGFVCVCVCLCVTTDLTRTDYIITRLPS